MNSNEVLLGFEVGSGVPVYLPLHHLAIFGMTAKSGKTTALEALISRSQRKAIAFITKRGEGGFTSYNPVTPYYEPRADWQFVEGLVNVALGEKVKFEPGMRYGIMQVCKGHKDLKEIQQVARDLAKNSKREFMKSVYEKLVAYLDIVIPELDKWTFTETLEIKEGVNVMNLTGMRLETQHLVMASTIEYAFANLDHVIVIIPEAWESIPQGKMTPVKWVAQQYIRKGAALGNYLFLDSQDIGGIDKTPLRQVDNWLMGRMKEAHEVERILKQLMGAKISAIDIQTLPLGHFFAALGNDVKKVYVLPLGVPEDVGIQVATGRRSPESVRDEFLKVKVMEENDLEFKEKYEKLLKEMDGIRSKAFEEGLASVSKELSEDNKVLSVEVEHLRKENVAVQKIKEGFHELLPTWQTLAGPPAENSSSISFQKVVKVVEVPIIEKLVTINTENMRGKILTVAKKGKLDTWRKLDDVVKAVEEERWSATSQEVNNALNDLEKQDLIAKKHTDRNYYCLAQNVKFEEDPKQ
jgi:hypothetical protein